MNLSELSISAAGRFFRDGSLSPVELTQHCLARIRSADPDLHSFNTVTADLALAAAAAAEAELKAGQDRGLMHGIPYAAKDIIDTEGVLTSCQSRLHVDNRPATDARVIARLKDAGSILLGKTATYEFATGGPATDVLFPPARNPWDADRSPGGSSSGSAAAIAAGFTRVALGTDTGGSVREPASFCGTVGIKPTFGRVSRRGVYPLSHSLDHCGLLAWSAEDAAIALQAVAGFDPLDPSSANNPVPDYVAAITRGGAGLSIAIATNWCDTESGASAELVSALQDAAAIFEKSGARVEEIDAPHWREFVAACRIILHAEGYAIHQRNLTERGDLYGRRARSRLMTGAFIGAADYVNAQRLRRRLSERLNFEVMAKYDVLIVPTTLNPAPRFSEISDDPNQFLTRATMPFNVTGNPAMSLCCGFTRAGLPLGMQLVGSYFGEATLFEAAGLYAASTTWSERRPKMAQVAA